MRRGWDVLLLRQPPWRALISPPPVTRVPPATLSKRFWTVGALMRDVARIVATILVRGPFKRCLQYVRARHLWTPGERLYGRSVGVPHTHRDNPLVVAGNRMDEAGNPLEEESAFEEFRFFVSVQRCSYKYRHPSAHSLAGSGALPPSAIGYGKRILGVNAAGVVGYTG